MQTANARTFKILRNHVSTDALAQCPHRDELRRDQPQHHHPNSPLQLRRPVVIWRRDVEVQGDPDAGEDDDEAALDDVRKRPAAVDIIAGVRVDGLLEKRDGKSASAVAGEKRKGE